MRDLFVSALNARDPSLVDQPGVPNPELIEEKVETMNERWPTLMLTNGDLDGQPVAVLWAPDGSEEYQQVAHVEIVAEEDGFDLTYVEEVPPGLVAEEPAGRNVVEWESEAEIEEGEGRWV